MKIAAALAKVQAVLKPAALNKENPHLKTLYADLGSVWEACRKPLTDNGIAVFQHIVTGPDGKLWLDTILMHESGEALTSRIPLLLGQQTMQGVGSAITYARRYGLLTAVGVTAEDDDGERAKPAQRENTQRSERPPNSNRNAAPKQEPPKGPQGKLAEVTKPPVTPIRTFADEDANLKRPREVIVKEIMGMARTLGVGSDLQPPNIMAGLAKIGQNLFNTELEKLTEDQLEKMLAKLNDDMRGK